MALLVVLDTLVVRHLPVVLVTLVVKAPALLDLKAILDLLVTLGH